MLRALWPPALDFVVERLSKAFVLARGDQDRTGMH